MSVKLFKFTPWRVALTALIALAFYYFEYTRFDSVGETALVLVASYLIAYLLSFLHQGYRLIVKRRAVLFDLGGVVTKGEYFTSVIEMREGMRELVKGLRRKNITAILSNQNWEAHKLFERKFKFDELFDVQVISGREGVKKPDPRIYKIALKRVGAKPRNAVFIDDTAENLEPAAALGMKTIHFQSAQQATQELKRMGFL